MTRRPKAARAGYPARVVCLTEETVETLFAIGAGSLVVGVSAYARRPAAIKHLPRVCAFITAKLDRIDALEPDLVLAFSDLQADIVRDLVKRGHNVHCSNVRYVDDILDNIRQVGAMVGYASEAQAYARKLERGVEAVRRKAARRRHRPRVYFEEWDNPMITGIAWVGELIDIAGGRDIFPELRAGVTAESHKVDPAEVVLRAPEVILASWCGKKVDVPSILERPGWGDVPAIRHRRVHEISSTLILQPGPAALTEGLQELSRLIGLRGPS